MFSKLRLTLKVEKRNNKEIKHKKKNWENIFEPRPTGYYKRTSLVKYNYRRTLRFKGDKNKSITA